MPTMIQSQILFPSSDSFFSRFQASTSQPPRMTPTRIMARRLCAAFESAPLVSHVMSNVFKTGL